MEWTLKVMIILAIASSVRSQFDDYGSGVSSNEDLYLYNIPEEEIAPRRIEEHREIINKLYGSVEEADSRLWMKFDKEIINSTNFCEFNALWVLLQLKATVETKGGILTEDEKKLLLSAVKEDIEREIDEAEKTSPKKDCRKFFNHIQKYRSHLDCVLGSTVVTEVFAKIDPEDIQCSKFAGDLWKSLVKAGDLSSKRCSVSGTYQDLIGVTQIARGRYTAKWDAKSQIPVLDLMAKLTETLSIPTRIAYLARISCPAGKPPTDCNEILRVVIQTVCREITIETVKDVEELIKVGVNGPRDMPIMLDLLTDLTKIMEELSKDKRHFLTRSPKAAVDTLDSYIDIMDNALGKSSQPVWAMLSQSETKEQLQRVLVNNERYIGAMSKILFNSKRDKIHSRSLNKATMAVELFQFHTKNVSELVGFQFSETRIEAKLPGYDSVNELNVYAIHYKTWAELMQAQGMKANNSRYEKKNKLFVGDGGIVSLSALTDREKISLPVSYKMNFKKASIEQDVATNGDTLRLCMSCEYLNTVTGEWEDTGCVVEGVNEEGISCRCNHTTNFAAFMSPVPITIVMTDAQYQAKQILSYVGSTVSVLALTTSLIVFNIVRPTVKNPRLTAHINLAVALFVVHMTQLVADFATNIDAACLTIAVITHFFLLASFFWMLIEGIFLYLYVVQVFVHSTISYMRWLYIAGWALPSLIVAISAGVGIPRDTYLDLNENPNYCEESEVLYPPLGASQDSKYERCWLSAKSGMVWSFIGPALAIIFTNSIILCKVFQVLKKVSGRSNNMRPFQPSIEKDPTNGYVNRSYGRKDSESQAQRKESVSKGEKSKKLKHENGTEYESTPLTHHSQSGQKANDSLSRFDGRIPSQAYMYNRAHAIKSSPEKGYSQGRHFLDDVRAAMKGALVLLPILGIPWIFGLWVANNYIVMMLFIFINSTQGLVIFVIYCVMNGEVKRAMKRRLKVAKLKSQSGRSRASSTSSLRSLNSRFTRSWRGSSSEPPLQ